MISKYKTATEWRETETVSHTNSCLSFICGKYCIRSINCKTKCDREKKETSNRKEKKELFIAITSSP